MAYPRRLDDEALAAARLEYETAPLSTRALAVKYGVSKSSMAEWVQREGWVKYRSSQAIERQLEHDIRVESQATEGAALAKGLARSLRAIARRRRELRSGGAPCGKPGQQRRTVYQTRPRRRAVGRTSAGVPIFGVAGGTRIV